MKPNRINPDEVLVEQSKLDEAEVFVSGDQVFNDLDDESREVVIERVARMLTTIDVALFLSPPGDQHAVSLPLRIGEQRLYVLVIGEITDVGMQTHTGCMSEEEFIRYTENT
jgi:hypothetical protein